MENEKYVHLYRNLDYTHGMDLVRCNYCSTLQCVPFSMSVCPECGEVDTLQNIEQDVNEASIRYEYGVIEGDASYDERVSESGCRSIVISK